MNKKDKRVSNFFLFINVNTYLCTQFFEMKKSENLYVLEHRKLGIGKYSLNFNLSKDFFDIFEYSEYENGNIEIILDVEIRLSSIIANLNISGEVEVLCDICLEKFNHKIKSDHELVFKFTSEFLDEDSNDELIYVSDRDDKIDLKEIFYDYIVLSLPIKKVHPLNKKGKRTCNPEILKKLEELKKQKKTNDPRWDKLNKLFN